MVFHNILYTINTINDPLESIACLCRPWCPLCAARTSQALSKSARLAGHLPTLLCNPRSGFCGQFLHLTIRINSQFRGEMCSRVALVCKLSAGDNSRGIVAPRSNGIAVTQQTARSMGGPSSVPGKTDLSEQNSGGGWALVRAGVGPPRTSGYFCL